MQRHCNFCNKDQDENDFHWRNRIKGTRISRCRFCCSDYSKSHYRANKNMYIEKIRKWEDRVRVEFYEFLIGYFRDHPCVDCGETDPVVLTFDHVRGKKKFNISGLRMTKRIVAIVVEEINKCEVRCANFHLRKTMERGNFKKFKICAALAQ